MLGAAYVTSMKKRSCLAGNLREKDPSVSPAKLNMLFH